MDYKKKNLWTVDRDEKVVTLDVGQGLVGLTA